MKLIGIVVALVLLAALLTGCCQDPPLAGTHERVVVALLSKDQLVNYATKASEPKAGESLSENAHVVDQVRTRMAALRPDWSPQLGGDREFALGPAAVVGYLADAGLKQLGELIREHATRYQATYDGQTRLDSAWVEHAPDGWVSAFDGFEIRRELVPDSPSNATASTVKILAHAVFLVEPLRSDSGLQRIVPIFVVDRRPRALNGGNVTLTLRSRLTATWSPSPIVAVRDEPLGRGPSEEREAFDFTFVLPRYKVGEELASQSALGTSGEWYSVYCPPRPTSTGSRTEQVPIRLVVSMQEVDTSKAAKFWRGLADLLDNQRAKVVEIVKANVAP